MPQNCEVEYCCPQIPSDVWHLLILGYDICNVGQLILIHRYENRKELCLIPVPAEDISSRILFYLYYNILTKFAIDFLHKIYKLLINRRDSF